MGSDGRSSLALLMAAVLLTSSAAAPAVAQAGESESSSPCEHCADLPTDEAYDKPAVLIRVTWKPQKDVRLNYWAAPPGSDPYTGAYWSGDGCVDGPRPSEPAQPLVLTEAWVGGKNLWYEPGSFELIAEAHACVFADDIDEKDPSREGPKHRAVCAAVPSVQVTATVEHYRAGESAPHKVEPPVEPMSAPVTLYPCERKRDQDWPDPDKYRRVLGSFDWDPTKGVTNVQAANPPIDGQAAELSPLDPRVGVTDAGSPPDSYDDPPSPQRAAADPPKDASKADARALPDVLSRFSREELRDLVNLLIYFGGTQAGSGGTPQDAADMLLRLLLGIDLTTPRPPPEGSPPEGSPPGDLLKPGRQWVYVAVPVTVRYDWSPSFQIGDWSYIPPDDTTLLPGRWYQGQKYPDGSWDVYGEDGFTIGQSLAGQHERVRPYTPPTSSPTGTEGTDGLPASEPADKPIAAEQDATAPGDPAAGEQAVTDFLIDLARDSLSYQPPPPAPPPKRKLKPDRQWVSLPGAFLVFDVTGPMVTRQWLDTGAWYQVRENEDGSRDFYNKKGRHLGTSPAAHRRWAKVETWDTQAQEQR